jgi:hypothetical protein
MTHFSSQVWVDFIRHVATPQDSAAITQHLDTGCESCSREKTVWSKVAAFAKTESTYEPPQNVVNVAKSLMQPPKAERKLRLREIARLVYDSFAAPELVGVRSAAGVGSRQLLYRAGEVMIDVRFEEDEGSERFALTGQVFRDSESKIGMTRVPISLISGKDELVRTSTNQFGEFYLEHESAKDLHVSLEISMEKDVFIPLDESVWRVAPRNS